MPERLPESDEGPGSHRPASETGGQQRVVALFASVTWGAVVFAVDGLLAVLAAGASSQNTHWAQALGRSDSRSSVKGRISRPTTTPLPIRSGATG